MSEFLLGLKPTRRNVHEVEVCLVHLQDYNSENFTACIVVKIGFACDSRVSLSNYSIPHFLRRKYIISFTTQDLDGTLSIPSCETRQIFFTGVA